MHIHLLLGWRDPAPDGGVLARWLAEAAGARGLTFLHIGPATVEPTLALFGSGALTVGLYLDLSSEWRDPGEAYHRLAYAARAAGAVSLDDPDAARLWCDKAEAHERLLAAGLRVPSSVVLGAAEPDRDLSESERERVGLPCFIKPALGFGGKGVTQLNNGTAAEIGAARAFDRADRYLIQRRVDPLSRDGRLMYLRGYHLAGELSLLWWHPQSHRYELVTMDEVGRFGLWDAVHLIGRLARTTGLPFQSSELALTTDGWTLVDYVNDQCDLVPQSVWPEGPPDPWARRAIHRIAATASRLKQRLPPEVGYDLWLP